MSKTKKVILITFANAAYAARRERLVARAAELGCFDSVISYSPENIDAEFAEENASILSQERGAGYWLWKPYFILKTIMAASEGDIVLYLDAGDWIEKSPREFLLKTLEDSDLVLTRGGYRNADWTKGDCFELMKCNSPSYWGVTQLEAGIIACKKSMFSITFIAEWLAWCRHAPVLTDDPNVVGYNAPTFCEHRHDQSILTCLMVKHGLRSQSGMRDFIVCNFETQ